MKILKVTQAYYPYLEKGAAAVMVPQIAEGLSELDHRVTVLTTDLGPRAPAEPQPPQVEVIYLSTIARYRSGSINPGVIGFCRRRLHEFDVVHIYGLYDLLGPVVAFFCRRSGVPYIVEPMGMVRPIVRSIRLKRLHRALLGRRLMSGACRLVAKSEQEQRELVEAGQRPEKVAVRRNGITLPKEMPKRGGFRRQWGIPAETMLVLFLGRLVRKKSPDLLVRAFAGCAPRGAVLAVAGPDEGDGYGARLRALAKELGIGSQVLFPGPLYGDAKWAAYGDADLYVLPSQNENFGNTVAEAVACGAPVIVTDQCGVAPLIEGRAGLVIPYDPNALQEALRRLLADEPLRRKLQAGCRELTPSLSWEQPLAQMDALYAEVVTRAPDVSSKLVRVSAPTKACLR